MAAPLLAQPLLIGIDLGTSRIRAVLTDAGGAPLGFKSEPTPVSYPRAGETEHDPEALWQTTARLLRRLTAGCDSKSITGIAVASFGESLIAIGADGAPLAPAIAWHDQRTRDEMAWLGKQFGEAALFARSGLRLDPTLGLCKLLWMRKHWPQAMARAVKLLGVADWIAFRLSGIAATDYSLASRSLALDLPAKRWNDDLLRSCGIEPDLMAELRPSGGRLGNVTAAASSVTGLPVTAMVGVGGHDHLVGALAAGVTAPGTVLDSLGTAEVLLRTLPAPILSPEAATKGYWQGMMRVAPALDLFYILGALPSSGGAVEWFRTNCAPGASHAALIAEAAAVPPASGVCFLPHLMLATAPELDPLARGAFIGLTAQTTRGVLYRAVLEGLAYESRLVLEGMEALPGLGPLQSVSVIGGGSRNALFLSIKAAVLGQELACMTAIEGTAMGAALLGGIAAGVYRDMREALEATSAPPHLVPPDPALRARYDRFYQRVYRHFHNALQPLNAALADSLEQETEVAARPLAAAMH